MRAQPQGVDPMTGFPPPRHPYLTRLLKTVGGFAAAFLGIRWFRRLVAEIQADLD